MKMAPLTHGDRLRAGLGGIRGGDVDGHVGHAENGARLRFPERRRGREQPPTRDRDQGNQAPH